MSEYDDGWAHWEEAKKKAHDSFIVDMKNLALHSNVFSKLVTYEWDGTIESVNSPESMVRNAMMTRAVYRQHHDVENPKFEPGTKSFTAWENDIMTSGFYDDALGDN